MTTFAVSDVAPSRQPLPPISIQHVLARRLEGPHDDESPRAVEACGANQAQLVAPVDGMTHPLIEAAHVAFAEHYPLVLSPDDVWLCLAQGFAMHVEANAEALRSRFVRHEGQLNLEIVRDNFVKGSPHNDWQGCFGEWSDAIAAHIGKKRDLVVASFSTTGPIERAASELVLMSAMKRYFSFSLMTRCGIPSVTLMGTVEDWRAIRRRAEVFAEFDLGAWAAVLLPVLDRFVAAASGDADPRFWRSIYKRDDASGGPYVTGWINVLFPYLAGGRRREPITRNEQALAWSLDREDSYQGTTLSAFPRGLSLVPFLWKYLGTKIPMMLAGGFVGISQDAESRAVRPAIGWAVQEAPPTDEEQAR
ncbi:MAG TPA: DUF4419 domain-containing protein [Kofleriaceae bacterium]|nr:DUF4419 domain-containing protein [Kofleriaceae bacterium]